MHLSAPSLIFGCFPSQNDNESRLLCLHPFSKVDVHDRDSMRKLLTTMLDPLGLFFLPKKARVNCPGNAAVGLIGRLLRSKSFLGRYGASRSCWIAAVNIPARIDGSKPLSLGQIQRVPNTGTIRGTMISEWLKCALR